MSQELALNINQALALPSYLQGADLNVSAGLLATVGLGGNRIGFKGNRFRQIVNGKEEGVWDENYLDVIIIGAVPHISRIFYEGTYQQDVKTAPTCYSADGIAPPDDVKAKQSTKCEICPQNQKGSKVINGNKIKACAYFQRLVVMLAGDMEGIKYVVDVKAMGIFGDSHSNVNKYNIRDYTKLLANRGADVATLVTRLSFDTDESVPKLLFQPQRFITAEEYEVVRTSIGTPELENMLKINMTTVDISGEVDADTPVEVAQEEAENVAQVQEIADATPTASAQGLVMTPKANGLTYDDFVKEGWSNEDMIAEGYAEAPKVVQAPKAPPKPAAPPRPVASTAPAKPAQAAAVSTQRRAPGRPPAQAAAKPTPAPAAAQKPVPTQAPKPATGNAAPKPVTINKSVPIPNKPAAAPVATTQAVQETSTDAEVEDILAGLV